MKSERGASAILLAGSLFLLMGIAALAIDISNGYNERRQDQIAADIGVMAGAVETLGSNAVIRDAAIDFVQRNVPGVQASQWQALWEGCVDDERASLNASGYNFIPVQPPAGFSSMDCISIDPAGFVRVRTPQIEFEATFGKVLGADTLASRADAIARITNRAGGGILPFGILASAASGTNVCLRDSSGGHAEPPCDAGNTGNYGALESIQYGNSGIGTTQNCTGSPKKDVLAINIAIGLDHRVVPDPDGLPANEEVDTCGNINSGDTPDTLNTFQGISNGLVEGLVTGPVPGGFTPRLKQGSQPKINLFGDQVDNRPLWDYLLPSFAGTAGVSYPAICAKSTFNNLNPPFDYDGDGTPDQQQSWQHMQACLTQHVAMGSTTVLFAGPDDAAPRLNESARFAYVPQFWENSWPPGNSDWRHIHRFRATFVQTTWWKKGNTVRTYHPGEGGTFNGNNYGLIQLSGFLLPDATLPEGLRGSPPPGGGLNPFQPELYR